MDDMNREVRKESTTGEVPQTYQRHNFHLCISGRRWAVPSFFRDTTVKAVLLLKRPGIADFEEILTTEGTNDTLNPCFITRASFLPLTMPNSQCLAAESVLRVEVHVNSRVYFSVQLQLSRLLWEKKFAAKFKPYVHPLLLRMKDVGEGEVFLNVVRGSAFSAAPDAHKIQFHVTVSSGLWGKLKEGNITMAIATAAERGQWSRVYLSDPLRKPIRDLNSSAFPSVTMSRTELTGHSTSNPIRIELYGVRRRGALLKLGFVQVTLNELELRKRLDWRQTEYSYVSPDVQVAFQKRSSGRSEIRLLLARAQMPKSMLINPIPNETEPMSPYVARKEMNRKSHVSSLTVDSQVTTSQDFSLQTHSFRSVSKLSCRPRSARRISDKVKPTVRFPGDVEGGTHDHDSEFHETAVDLEHQYSLMTLDGHSMTWQ